MNSRRFNTELSSVVADLALRVILAKAFPSDLEEAVAAVTISLFTSAESVGISSKRFVGSHTVNCWFLAIALNGTKPPRSHLVTSVHALAFASLPPVSLDCDSHLLSSSDFGHRHRHRHQPLALPGTAGTGTGTELGGQEAYIYTGIGDEGHGEVGFV